LHFPCRLPLDDSVLIVGVECVEGTFCWSVSDSFSNTVDEDTRTVSIPELESILVALHLMDADAVYQAKQVLGCHD